MEETFEVNMNESAPLINSAAKALAQVGGLVRSFVAAIPARSRYVPVFYSLTDQALAVGAPFLANVALARTQTKEEFGIFVLSYSVYTFLYALYNAAVLEPYTVYGSGRHRDCFSEYLRLMLRSNLVIGLLLTIVFLSVRLLLPWIAPQHTFRAFAGLALTVGILLSGTFLRRTFYVQRQAALAAKASLVAFCAVACGLWLAARSHLLDSFSVFLILALGWILAGAAFGRKLALENPKRHFLDLEPGYWREHWRYSQWALATAFALQFTMQVYYWLVAAFLSVTDVAKLRATYLLVAPVEQVSIAISLLVLPALATHFAAHRWDDALSLWKRNALLVAGITSLFALAVRIAGKAVMHVLYSGKFDGLAPLLYVLALSPLFTGIGGTLVNALNAVEKPKLVFFACLCSGVATLLFGLPLVMHLGLEGAAFGMLASGGTYIAALAVGFLFYVYKPARRVIPDGVRTPAGVANE